MTQNISRQGEPNLPTFARGLSFIDFPVGDREAKYCVAGIPVDFSTSNRAGTREGPNAIRMASRLMYDGHHPFHPVDPVGFPASDIGNFDVLIGDIVETHRMIGKQARGLNHLVALGGEHSITLPLLRVLAETHGPLGMVQFDAHVDTWEENFGQRTAHGTPFFHAIDEGILDPTRFVQIGIRSPAETDVMAWTRDQGVTIITAEDVHMSTPQAVAAKVRDVLGDGASYFTFDVDGLDPAFAPATGTPEMGGLHSWQARAVIRRLSGIRFVGMDVVEVAPAFDVAEMTSLAAATVAWDYLALVEAQERPA